MLYGHVAFFFSDFICFSFAFPYGTTLPFCYSAESVCLLDPELKTLGEHLYKFHTLVPYLTLI